MKRQLLWLMRLGVLVTLLCFPRLVHPESTDLDSMEPVAVEAGYRIVRSFAIPVSHDPPGGTLRLLEDVRITEALRKEHWGVDGSTWGESAEMSPPLRKSRLEFLNRKVELVDSRELEVLADLQEQELDGTGSPTWLLTVDSSIGAGSNNGRVTTLLDLRQGRIQFLEVVDKRGKKSSLRLLQSLRSAWKLVPSRKSRAMDILEVTCPPGGQGGASRVFYARYHFSGSHWTVRRRSRPGLWLNELEDAFPKRSLFP